MGSPRLTAESASYASEQSIFAYATSPVAGNSKSLAPEVLRVLKIPKHRSTLSELLVVWGAVYWREAWGEDPPKTSHRRNK